MLKYEQTAYKMAVQNCNNIWYFCALQTLQQNDVSVEEFTSAVKELLHLGRGKLQNILIIGPANCGKTSLLKPLSLVYRSFVNPAHFISQLQRPTMPKAYFLRETDQYLQQVPLSYSLLDMVSRNTETDDESAMESFQIPPQNFRDPKRVYLTMWQMFCTTCFTRMTNFRKSIIRQFVFPSFVLFYSTIKLDSHN